jgi:hypothetical protein
VQASVPLPPRSFLALISVRGCANRQAKVSLEGIGVLKNSTNSLGIEPATFRFEEQYFNPIFHCLCDEFDGVTEETVPQSRQMCSWKAVN